MNSRRKSLSLWTLFGFKNWLPKCDKNTTIDNAVNTLEVNGDC